VKPVKKKPYTLRLEAGLGECIEQWARDNRRTFTAEIGLLIEQGIEWRQSHGDKPPSLGVTLEKTVSTGS